MRLRWLSVNAVCDGRLRETGETYEDFSAPEELLRRGVVGAADDEAGALADSLLGGESRAGHPGDAVHGDPVALTDDQRAALAEAGMAPPDPSEAPTPTSRGRNRGSEG
jgi:hypothetical protein